MRRYLCLLLISGCCVTARSDEPPAPNIKVPMVPGVLPDPNPSPVSGAVDKLTADSLYVVTADVPLLILQSPDGGLVRITAVKSPMNIFAKFADGNGAYESREYTQPHIYVLSPVKAGTCELMLIPAGVEDVESIVRQRLTVMGIGPQPPPGPGPDPGPGPTPIPGDANRVLIVYESSDLSRLPPSQVVLFSAGTVRDYLSRRCSVGPDGRTPEFRIWDKDVDLTNVPQVWRDAMGLPRSGLPWVVVSNGKTGFAGPLPANEADLMTLLRKYLGD